MLKAIKARLRKLSIRPLLLLSYGGTVLLVFAIVLLITVTAVFALRDAVISKSEEALKNQITHNARTVLAESGEVFEARLRVGLQTFALPAAYGVQDAVSAGDSYSLSLVSKSVTDSSANLYTYPARLQGPLTLDKRFPCDPTESTSFQSLRGCEAFSTDYPTVRGKKISAHKSAVFLTGLKYDGSNAQSLLDQEKTSVTQTAVLDALVRKSFQENKEWMGAWVATQAGGILRTFPGFVGNLTFDGASGTRVYNPTIRPWFKRHVGANKAKTIMSNSHLDKYNVEFTAPYKSLDGNGFLLSLSLPVHDVAGGFLGVAGTDIQVSALQDITRLIRFRASGVAHLYHASTGTVAASPQWSPGAGTSDVKRAEELLLQTGKQFTLTPSSTCSPEREERDGFVIMHLPTLDKKYCLAAVIPLDEILEPIESQRDEITTTANDLFVTCLVVILISFFGFVAPCSCCIAIQLSSPLIKTTAETRIIAGNIGGDLLQGLNVQKSPGGVGEVLYLRQGFLRMLNTLLMKREKSAVSPPNPAFGKLVSLENDAEGQARQQLQNVNVPEANAHLGRSGSMLELPPEPSKYNRIAFRVILQLIVPMVIAMIVIISYSSAVMYQNSSKWVEPVKEMMIEEELQNLKVRAYERAALVKELLAGYENTLNMVVDYSEELFSGKLPHVKSYSAHFTPQRWCPTGASGCAPKALESNSRVRGQNVNFDSSFWYAPGQVTAIPSRRWPDDKVFKLSSSAVFEQQGLATSLDNVARVAYFSCKTTQISWGFENHEIYRGYPYMPQFNQVGARFYCNDGLWGDRGTDIGDRYTPLCRDWYTKPRAANGKIVYGTVGVDISTKKPYLSIGRGFYHSSGKFIGVVDITINLADLENILKRTPLYENGMVYMFDKDGCAILHPYLDEEKRREAECVEQHKLSAAGDREFEVAFLEGVVGPGKRRENGTWANDWLNPDTGVKERWFYVFMPVPKTPYQLVLTAVDRDIWKAAQDLEGELNSLTTTHLSVSMAFFIVFALLLCYLSYNLNKRFAMPVSKLAGMIASAEKSGYKADVDTTEEVWSAELMSLRLNLKDMLTALRFGNPAYHGGNKLTELHNLREVKRLLEDKGSSERGMGVYQSNLGNCVRAMDPAARDKAILAAHESPPEKVLQDAVANARNIVTSGAHPDITMDTVGQRLVGLSLAELDAGKVDQAVKCVKEAIDIHTRSEKWQALVRLSQAYVQAQPDIIRANALKPQKGAIDAVSSALGEAAETVMGMALRQSSQQTPPEELYASVMGAANAALAAISREEGTAVRMDPADASSVASLCFVQYAFTGDASYLLWALNRLPQLDEGMICKLAKYAAAELGGNALSTLDSVLSPTMPNWQKGGGAGPKAVLFVLDASGSMSGGYLETCKQSISMIVQDYTNGDDLVGFIAFAHYTKEIFSLIPKSGNESRIQADIAAVQTFGGTAFYDAVVEGIEKLNAAPAAYSKWLVTLTDGADGHSSQDKNPPGRRGAQLLSQSDINVAVVTVGNLPAETINVVTQYVNACTSGGRNGMHVVASNTQKIAEAFQSIASMMDEGLAEAL